MGDGGKEMSPIKRVKELQFLSFVLFCSLFVSAANSIITYLLVSYILPYILSAPTKYHPH